MSSGSDELPYVPIVRHFREVDDDIKDALTRRMLRSMSETPPITWETLLAADPGASKSSAIVLVAASGAGKSTELKKQAERLVRDGHAAFYCEAGAMATDGLAGSVLGRRREIEAWLAGSGPGVLFVDAVDEVHLRQRDLKDVVRRLGNEVDLGSRAVQLVLTARTGVWSAAHRELVANLLRGQSEDADVKVVTFEPIDADAIGALAAAASVNDVPTFLRRFHEDELDDLLDLRPRDMLLFARYWNERGAFGTWTQILDEFVEKSVIEANPAHEPHQRVSRLQRGSALRRVAAATVLAKKVHVALPGGRPVPGALDGGSLFADWEGRLLGEVFGNGLFVHKGDAAVQLPQGALTHYLAAKWLVERYRSGWSLTELRDALFVKIFDDTTWRVPGSRLPLVGWVASGVPELRQVLLQVDPSVLLYEGDPKALGTDEILAALELILAQEAGGTQRRIPTTGTVRQLARPDLGDAILALLERYRDHGRLQQHLLLYVKAGGYLNCLPHAVALALDEKATPSCRSDAAEVVGHLGAHAEKHALLPLVSEKDAYVRAAVFVALVPEHLGAQPLVDFVLEVDHHYLRYIVTGKLEQLSLADADATLHALLAKIKSGIRTVHTESHVSVAAALLRARLRRETVVPPWFGDAVLALESRAHPPDMFDKDRRELEAVFASNPVARRAVWEARWQRFGESSDASSVAFPQLCKLQADDLGWVSEGRQRATGTPRLQHEMDCAIDHFYHGLDAEESAKLRKRLDLPAAIRERFERHEANGLEAEEVRRQRQELEQVEAERLRQAQLADWAARRAAIESGEDLHVLMHAWLRGQDSRMHRNRVDPKEIREHFGPDWAESFARGFKACWRRHDVSLPDPDANDDSDTHAPGLVGIALEIEDGLDLTTLTTAEAERAVRYGVRGFDGFPYWFERLHAAHSTIVRAALEVVLKREWLATHQHYGVMRHARQAPRAVGLVVRSVVLELAEAGAPGHPTLARTVVNTLLLSPDDGPRVASVARRFAEAAADADEESQYEWMRLWAHVEPMATATWLEQGAKASVDVFQRRVAALADLLDTDFEARSHASPTELMRAPALERWLRLLCLSAPPRIDAPYDRSDHVAELRRRCIVALSADPSVEAYRAFQRLLSDGGLVAHHESLRRAADDQVERATEQVATPWNEAGVVAVEQGDVQLPRSLDDLYRLVLRHLERVKDLVENDDCSYRNLFLRSTKEREIQRWVASSLKLVSRGLYTVTREPEVDDDKKPDILISAAGIARIPIELKPLGPYSFNRLKVCIDEQLCGQYMRPDEVRYGLLLLVRYKNKTWDIDGEPGDLGALVSALERYARTVGTARNKVIRVLAIDARKIGT